VVTTVTAVMTAVVATAMMPRAGVHVRAAAVRVLREDGTRAEDEREDENGCESEFLHWFSGSPLKEIGSDLKFVSVRRSRKQASLRGPPSSILDRRRRQRSCQRARRAAAFDLRVFSLIRRERWSGRLWHLCAALQNCHTLDFGF
jgi:hypothetical protein